MNNQKTMDLQTKIVRRAPKLAELIEGLSRREVLIIRKSNRHGFLVQRQTRKNIEM